MFKLLSYVYNWSNNCLHGSGTDTNNYPTNITTGPLLGYIIFCQIHVWSTQTFLSIETSVISNLGSVARATYYISKSLSEIWTLKVTTLIPLFCISDKITNWSALWFDYVPVVYTLFLVLITYMFIELYSQSCRIVVCMWRPFHYFYTRIKRRWSSNESIIHAYATILFLLFLKIIFTFIDSNKQTPLKSNNTTLVTPYVLQLNPHIESNSPEHIPHLLISTAVLFIFGFCPAIFLCLYPTKFFKRAMVYCCSARKRIALKVFADTFQGCYKDGFDGTKDYRMTPGIIMVIILIYSVLGVFSGGRFTYSVNWINITIMILLSVIVSYLQPCKSWLMNASLSFHLVVVSFLCVVFTMWSTSMDIDQHYLANAFVTLLIIPHILMLFWFIYKIVNIVRGQFYNVYNMSS